MDLSKLSDEELMKLRAGAPPVDLSHLSNEELMKLKPGTPVDSAPRTSKLATGAKDIAMGALKGASDIGTTLMRPLDATGLTGRTNEERKASLGGFFQDNADPESLSFKAGELAADVAGTAGVGGVLAKGVTAAAKVAPAIAQYAPKLAAAIESGGFTLNAAPAVTTAGKVANAATRAVGGAVTGAASAGLIDPSTAGTGAVIGGALPGAAKLAGMAGRAIAPEVSPEVGALYQKAKDLGIEIPADRIVNSKPMNAVAASLNYVPFSGRAASEDLMHSQFNRAVSRTFGQDSDNVTAALRKAQTALGDKFEVTLKSNNVVADEELLNDLTAHLEKATKELSPNHAKIIGNQIDDLIDKVKPDGTIDGQAAYNIKKTLDRIGNRNSNESFYARELKKSLMGALNRSLGPDEAAAFAKVRQQYGNMLDLEGLAANGAEGGVSVGRLANMKGINNPQLQDLADIAAQFVKGRESPHGAAQRVVLGSLGLGAAHTIPAAAPALAAGVVGARATNTALDSPVLKKLILGQRVGNAKTQMGSKTLRALLYDAPSLANP